MEYFDHNMLTIKGHRLFGFAAIREYAHDIAQSLYAMHFQGGTIHKGTHPYLPLRPLSQQLLLLLCIY